MTFPLPKDALSNGGNWFSGSEKSLLIALIYFRFNLPLENSVDLRFNKIKTPSPKNVLFHVWLKLVQWFWRIFSRFISVLFVILLLSSLGKRRGPSFELTWISFPQEWFVQRLVEIYPVVLEKKTKIWKVSDNNGDANDNDDGQRTNSIRNSHLSPWLKWTPKKVNFIFVTTNKSYDLTTEWKISI